MEKRKGEFLERAENMVKLAKEAISEGGSSYCNFDCLIQDIIKLNESMSEEDTVKCAEMSIALTSAFLASSLGTVTLNTPFSMLAFIPSIFTFSGSLNRRRNLPELLSIRCHPRKVRRENVRLRGLLPVDPRAGEPRRLAGNLRCRDGGVREWEVVEGVPDFEGEWVEDGASSAAEEARNQRHSIIGERKERLSNCFQISVALLDGVKIEGLMCIYREVNAGDFWIGSFLKFREGKVRRKNYVEYGGDFEVFRLIK
nr:7-deoxyloganetic acid glucosyltransferase-like [Ipomoea batatas]GMD57624.1 7-deoxyloganetic acid glucosyltransferase-like [Ipomoea batatas]